MIRRTYTGEADLKLLQDFNARAIAVTDHIGYIHPGDIPHRLFNGNRSYDPADIMTIWEDEQGVAAWVRVGPRHKFYDAQVRPDLRGHDFEREVLAYADHRLLELMDQHNISGDYIYGEAFREDTARIQLLTALGWEAQGQSSYILNRTEINTIEVPVLPDGFTLQSAKSIEDAAALADVHSASFGSSWTPEMYQKLMESPGYEPERELVVQAPDGTFVAFCIIWFDRINRIGLFEPVGTHKDYRRRGFGRAIILYGLQQMAAVGMKFATVAHARNNEAAKGLYKSCGFNPWHLEEQFKKAR